MSTLEMLGISGGIVGILGFFPYAYKVVTNEDTKPQRSTWLIWAVIGVIVLLSYDASGADTTVYIAMSYSVGPVIIFLLSIKYGIGGWSSTDKKCLIAAALGLMFWVILDRPDLTLASMLIIDVAGFLPTYLATRKGEYSESKTAWLLWSIAGLLTVSAIDKWTLEISAYPFYMATASMLMFYTLSTTRSRKQVV